MAAPTLAPPIMCIHCDAIGPICMDIASRDFEGMCMLSPSERAAYFAETRREDLPLVTDQSPT